jgi:3-deoxy-D-manno-octulosonate 8-phosphate phosphatase KdsC-like HAD superfamily phosphatase
VFAIFDGHGGKIKTNLGAEVAIFTKKHFV